MALADLIVIGVIILILGLVITYIIRAKKSGVKCIGCPMSKNCSSNKAGKDKCCCNRDNECP